jgi:hypothetical protein
MLPLRTLQLEARVVLALSTAEVRKEEQAKVTRQPASVRIMCVSLSFMRRIALLYSLTGQASLWQVDRLFSIDVALDVALVQGIVQRSTGAAHNCKIPLGGVKARPLPSNVAAPPKSDGRACTPAPFTPAALKILLNAGFRAENAVLQWRPCHCSTRSQSGPIKSARLE